MEKILHNTSHAKKAAVFITELHVHEQKLAEEEITPLEELIQREMYPL